MDLYLDRKKRTSIFFLDNYFYTSQRLEASLFSTDLSFKVKY